MDKAAKFRSLAEKNVSKVLILIRRIGGLSNRSRYQYTPEQVVKMFKAMHDELVAAEDKFTNNSDPREPFRLD